MKIKTLVALAACGLSSIAMAGMTPAASNNGPYVGIGAGYGRSEFSRPSNAGVKAIDSSKNNSFAGRVFAGYDVNNWIAVEAGYTHLFTRPQLKLNFSKPIIDGKTSTPWINTKRVEVVDLVGIISATVHQDVYAYMKCGANYLMADKKAFNVTYGAGVEWDCCKDIAVGIEWMRYNGKCSPSVSPRKTSALSHVDTFMVNARYSFDI